MADLSSALGVLVEHPPAPSEPVHALRARLEPRRRRHARRTAAVGAALVAVVVAGVVGVVARIGHSDHVGDGAGPAAASAPGGGLALTYVPEGFALTDDVEHLRHALGDRLRVVTYTNGPWGEGLSFEVVRQVGKPLDVEAELALGPGAVPVSVNGREGVESGGVGVLPAYVRWRATRAVTLGVASVVVDLDELRRIADGIRYHPGADNLELPSAAAPVDGNRRLSEEVVVDRGKVDGVSWELVVYEGDRGVCLEMRSYRSGGGGCDFRVPAERVLEARSGGSGSLQFVNGVVREDVVEVRVELASGSAFRVATVGEDLGFGVRFFAASVPWGHSPIGVAGLDANGEEVARQELRSGPSTDRSMFA